MAINVMSLNAQDVSPFHYHGLFNTPNPKWNICTNMAIEENSQIKFLTVQGLK